jgi:hypothetical protein
LATVKDAVNCCVAAFEETVAEVAEIAVEAFADEAVETSAAFVSDFTWGALSEFLTGLPWFWSPECVVGVAGETVVWECTGSLATPANISPEALPGL